MQAPVQDIIEKINNAQSAAVVSWAQSGITDIECKRRMGEFVDSIYAELQAFQKKQEAEVEEMTQRKNNEEAEISHLCRQLYPDAGEAGSDNASDVRAVGPNLTAQLQSLEPKLSELREERDTRMKRFNALKTRIFDASASMGRDVASEYREIGENLSGAREGAFADQATVLEKDQQNRRVALTKSLNECASLLDELEMRPCGAAADASDVDVAAVASEGSSERRELGLSDAAIQRVSERCSALTQERAARERRLKEICADVKALWDRLGVPQETRDTFYAAHVGMGEACLAGCEVELERLRELKRERLGELIEDARAAIRTSWDTLQYSDGARAAFTGMQAASSAYTEELLDAHEAEQKRLAELVDEVRPLLDLIDTYGSILKERDENDKVEADKSRLLKRGSTGGASKGRASASAASKSDGQPRVPAHVLRKREEEMRRRIMTLPKRAAQLQRKLKAWEEKAGPLIINGAPYLETMQAEDREYLARKQEQMLAKKKRKKEELMNGKTYHSPQKRKIIKTKTPSKSRSRAAVPPRAGSRAVMTAKENTTR